MRTRHLVGIFALGLFAVGCGKKETPSPPPAASASASAPVEEKPARPKADDLGVAQVKEPLKCTPGSKRPICQTLTEFEGGKTWNLETIRSAEGRYFGQGTVVEKGKERAAYFFLVVKKVPSNEVPAGDIAIKTALRELEADRKTELTQAPRLIHALQSDDPPPKNNSTVSFIQSYTPNTWDGAGPTKGVSTVLHNEGGVFVREIGARRLAIVKLAAVAPGGVAGDGLYLSLYPMTW